MKVIFFTGAVFMVFTLPAVAQYVSPVKYKDLTCEEMKVEWRDLLLTSIDTMTEQSKWSGNRSALGKKEYARITEEYNDIEAERKALDKAMERVNCTPGENKD